MKSVILAAFLAIALGCVTPSQSAVDTTIHIVDTNEDFDTSNCTKVRSYHAKGGIYGGRVGQSDSINQIVAEAENDKIDTLVIVDSSWFNGAMTARGYRCSKPN